MINMFSLKKMYMAKKLVCRRVRGRLFLFCFLFVLCRFTQVFLLILDVHFVIIHAT